MDFRTKIEEVNAHYDQIVPTLSPEYMPLVDAAKARLVEALAFIEISAQSRPSPDMRLARMDQVVREAMDMVAKAIDNAGIVDNTSISIDELDAFLVRQEQADAALVQARLAATALIIHLDRALKIAEDSTKG